jgi:hypothetical protein
LLKNFLQESESLQKHILTLFAETKLEYIVVLSLPLIQMSFSLLMVALGALLIQSSCAHSIPKVVLSDNPAHRHLQLLEQRPSRYAEFMSQAGPTLALLQRWSGTVSNQNSFQCGILPSRKSIQCMRGTLSNADMETIDFTTPDHITHILIGGRYEVCVFFTGTQPTLCTPNRRNSEFVTVESPNYHMLSHFKLEGSWLCGHKDSKQYCIKITSPQIYLWIESYVAPVIHGSRTPPAGLLRTHKNNEGYKCILESQGRQRMHCRHTNGVRWHEVLGLEGLEQIVHVTMLDHRRVVVETAFGRNLMTNDYLYWPLKEVPKQFLPSSSRLSAAAVGRRLQV